MSRTQYQEPNIKQYIEAQTGYFLLQAYPDDDGKVYVHKRCIIAWAIDESLGCISPYPVTLEGIVLDNLPILLPSGFIEVPNVCDWNNLDEWLEFEKQKAKGEQGGKAK
jgi:hypothetical protein